MFTAAGRVGRVGLLLFWRMIVTLPRDHNGPGHRARREHLQSGRTPPPRVSVPVPRNDHILKGATERPWQW